MARSTLTTHAFSARSGTSRCVCGHLRTHAIHKADARPVTRFSVEFEANEKLTKGDLRLLREALQETLDQFVQTTYGDSLDRVVDKLANVVVTE